MAQTSGVQSLCPNGMLVAIPRRVHREEIRPFHIAVCKCKHQMKYDHEETGETKRTTTRVLWGAIQTEQLQLSIFRRQSFYLVCLRWWRSEWLEPDQRHWLRCENSGTSNTSAWCKACRGLVGEWVAKNFSASSKRLFHNRSIPSSSEL